MQKHHQVKMQTRIRKTSDQSIPNNLSKGKQNSLLSALSIKQLNNIKTSEFLRTKKFVMPIIGQKRNSEGLTSRRESHIKTLGFQKSKNESDSFQTNQNEQNKDLFNQTVTKKQMVYLPPIESKSTFTENTRENTLRDPLKSRIKSKGKTHCKIILSKNKKFPFLRTCNRTAKTDNQVYKTEDIFGVSDFDQLKISLIEVAQEREKFISKESLKQIALA